MRAQALASPEFAPRRSALIAVRNTAPVYEGAGHSRRTVGWRDPLTTANTGVLGSLATLRDRSRAAVRSNGYAKSAIDKIVTNAIGTGITLRSKADDIAFRKAADALFEEWCYYSDADGVLDWFGQQTQAARAMFEGGEVFLRLRQRLPTDGLPVPLQVQLIEPELCPHAYFAIRGANIVKAGVEFDPIGRRVAYYFYNTRPDIAIDFYGQLSRVPAENVIHLFDPQRPGQIRGVPLLTQALVKLHDLDEYDDATLLRQKIANLFVGFIKKATPAIDESLNPLTGLATVADGHDRPMVTMEPGLVQELDPGDEVDFAKPPDAGATYEPFMRQQLMASANAIGLPYELLTWDLSKVNDRTVRVLLNEFRRRVMAWQHQIFGFQLCRRVWNAFMDRAFIAGNLPIPAAYATNPLPWSRVDWAPHGWPYLHPVQDVESQVAAIRAGFTTRSAVVAEQGDDASDIDHEQADDNARADALGLEYESDGRTPVDPAAQALGKDPGHTGETA